MAARYNDLPGPLSPSNPYGPEQTYPPPLTGPGDEAAAGHYSQYSQSSLPRYNSMYQPLSPGQQPPPQQLPQSRYRSDSRYSSFPTNAGQAQAHPLSNALYADSTPTLQGSTEEFKEKSLPPLNTKETGFKRLSGTFVNGKRVSDGDDGLSPTIPRKARLGYLDGLKFIAAWVVLNGTFFDAAVPDSAYSAVQRSSPLYIFRSTNLGIAALILLSGRSLVENLWDVPNRDSPKAPSGPTVSWYRVSRALLTRPFRFILPVLVIAGTQWGLGATGKTGNCNNVGMDEPYWSQISSFAGYATLVFDLFTWFEIDTVSGQAFGANLWITPWLFQGSYCAYVSHIMLGNLSSNRYWIYFALGAFSWFSFNFFTLTVIGVVIADMVVHDQFKRIQKWPFFFRLAVQIALVAIALVTQWINPIRDNLNSGMNAINVTHHRQITFADLIFVTCGLVIVESSTICQFVFGNVVMRMLGKLSAGLVLLAPVLTFTVVPDLALSMHKSNSSASAITGVTWLVLFLACFGLAIVFHLLVEVPSKLVGEYYADLCLHWGQADSTRDAIREANKKARAALGAPVEAPARLRKAIRS